MRHGVTIIDPIPNLSPISGVPLPGSFRLSRQIGEPAGRDGRGAAAETSRRHSAVLTLAGSAAGAVVQSAAVTVPV